MKTFYFHCGTKEHGLKEGHRPCTIAGVLDGTTLKLGVAQTSPVDVFNKKLGREIAEGRANKQTPKNVQKGLASTVAVPQGTEHIGKFFNEVAEGIAVSELTKVKFPVLI